jgi:hypothetical protein
MKKGSKTSIYPSNAADELRTALRLDKNGIRASVPVFGSGLNIQAANIQGQTEDDWSGLLARIAATIGLSEKLLEDLPLSNLARWESLLRLWARTKRIEPYQAEAQLQKLACEHLRTCEQTAAGWQLYREVVNARFLDIVSLNFDRRIALSSEQTEFVNAPANCREGPKGEMLYRHDRISHPGGGCTRVWYPHGDTRKFPTLKLGVRQYGFHLVLLEESRQGFGDEWRVKRGWEQSVGHEYKIQDSKKRTPKWTDVFLNRTLVFIGCGLSLDEWALWWMIRTRALIANDGRKKSLKTIHVSVRTTLSSDTFGHIFKQHGIIALEFDSFDELWKAVRNAIS